MSQLGAASSLPPSMLQSIQQQLNMPTIINASTGLKPSSAIPVTPGTITVVGGGMPPSAAAMAAAAAASKSSTIKLQETPFVTSATAGVLSNKTSDLGQRPMTPQQQQQQQASMNQQVQGGQQTVGDSSASNSKRGSNFQQLPSKVCFLSLLLLLF